MNSVEGNYYGHDALHEERDARSARRTVVA